MTENINKIMSYANIINKVIINHTLKTIHYRCAYL